MGLSRPSETETGVDILKGDNIPSTAVHKSFYGIQSDQVAKVDWFVKTRKFDLIDIIDEALNLQFQNFFRGLSKHQLLIPNGLVGHSVKRFSRHGIKIG